MCATLENTWFWIVREKIQKNNIKIKELYGINGIVKIYIDIISIERYNTNIEIF